MKLREKLTASKYPYARMFVILTALCLLALSAALCLGRGPAFSKYFFIDQYDCFNDWFNCIPGVKGYGIGSWICAQYPPLAKFIFLVAAHIYSGDNDIKTAIRNTAEDPRMDQSALIPFFAFVIFCVFAIILISSRLFKDDDKSCFTGVALACTYGILSAIARGNVILLSAVLALFFVAYYRSDNKALRELAYISLALSAGIKLYPAAFGILILTEKRWFAAVRTFIYGILSLVIPYFIIKGHVPAQNTGSFAQELARWAKTVTEQLLGDFAKTGIILPALFIICTVYIVISAIKYFVTGKYLWKKVLYCGFIAILGGMAFSFPYSVVFIMPSLAAFLKEKKGINAENIISFVLLCVILLPLPLIIGHRVIAYMHMAALFALSIYASFEIWLPRRKKRCN